MADDDMLTVADVARRLHVHDESVRRWLRDGKLQGSRLGRIRGGWRIEPSELERFKREGPAR